MLNVDHRVQRFKAGLIRKFIRSHLTFYIRNFGGPMKVKLIFIVFCLMAFSSAAFAQNTVKLFNAVGITSSDASLLLSYNSTVSFGTAQVYLSCPVGEKPQATLTGPYGGQLVVDNFLTVNGTNVCSGQDSSCFSSIFTDPVNYLGQASNSSYMGVNPIDISNQVTGSGLYTFGLMDFGYTLASSDIYLNTSCSMAPAASQVCHQDNGKKTQKTLTVGPAALSAHLAHGDSEGPCSQ
jgi:hypothetical protein